MVTIPRTFSMSNLTNPNEIVQYLNVRKDPLDLRDQIFRSSIFSQPEHLPSQVDLRDRMSPIVNQGQLGSCTANAIVSGLREYLLKQSGRPFVPLSRLFLYYHERELENDIPDDHGALLRDGMKVLQQIGVCPETDYPYTENFRDTPSPQAEADAPLYRIGEYHRVLDLLRLKSALAHGLPVVFGFSVTKAFLSPEVQNTGVVPVTGPDDVVRNDNGIPAGHAVCAVGYEDNKQLFIVRNSWGREWGDQGYGYFPYELFQNGIVLDMWTGR